VTSQNLYIFGFYIFIYKNKNVQIPNKKLTNTMEDNQIINFAEYFEKSKFKKKFDKNEFNDFFLNESREEDYQNKEMGSQYEEDSEEKETMDNSEPESNLEIETGTQEDTDEYYPIFKDKNVDFSCDITLEGAKIEDTEVRLILESDDWNIMFKGETSKEGKCIIPIKKMVIFQEGKTGNIKLEVIADGSVFTPWEDKFIVKLSKKVEVKIHESKRSKPSLPKLKESASVKVNVKR